jgi:hypothetical protein
MSRGPLRDHTQNDRLLLAVDANAIHHRWCMRRTPSPALPIIKPMLLESGKSPLDDDRYLL